MDKHPIQREDNVPDSFIIQEQELSTCLIRLLVGSVRGLWTKTLNSAYWDLYPYYLIANNFYFFNFFSVQFDAL